MRGPTYYFSADTDRRTTDYRAVANRTRYTFGEVKGMVGTSRGHHQRNPIEVTGDDIFFCFDPALSLRDIDLEIQAYEEVFGEGTSPWLSSTTCST